MRLLCLFPVLALAAGLGAQHEPATVVDLAVGAGNFKTLVTAVQKAGLDKALAGKGPFTVFAPTDAAFAAVDPKTLAALLLPENKDQLVAVLKYHVVAGSMPASKVVGQKELATLQGSALTVVVDGDKVTIGGAKITATDLMAGNGVVHVIDRVLMPPKGPAIADNIVAAADAAGTFKTLLRAAVAAGLAETLTKDGPFTVFAPNDAAFAKIDPHALADLLKPENKQKLAAVLKYHVVAGKVLAAEAKKLTKAKTLADKELAIELRGDSLFVGGAKVIATDVLAKNGVVHVIDTVLMPQQ